MEGIPILMLVLSYSIVPLSNSDDSITPGRSISAKQTLTSAGGNFALGFFSPGNSTNSYLGIWYSTIPRETVIWVANRESPIPRNSSAVFALGEDGNLVLLSEGVRVIWSSNVSDSALNPNSTVGVLLDTGNLVLRHVKYNNILWQSFDYPSDTYMPGMKLGFNRKTGRESRITSWANEEDPRPGIFSLGMDPRGRQTYLLKQQNPYWRTNVYAANLSSTIYNKSQGFASSISYVEDGDEVYTSYSVSQSWVALRFKIVPSGQYELQLWQQSSSTWQVLREVPHVGCDFYGHCGPNGSCDQSGSVSLCNCLTGFEPKIQTDWITGNWTGGCVRKKELSCNSGDGFLKLPRMKLPDHSWSLGNKTASECEFQCRGNCSCTAYACLNVSGELAVNCLVWFGDLIDLVNNHETGQDLYVHLHGSELGGNGESKKISKNRRSLIAVAVATISIGVLLISIFGYMLRRKRLRKPGLVDRVGHKDGELISFSLKAILAATGNFSTENKLGEGGFGPVFKGYLPGDQEVAIKRLSKKSSQGMEEFLNELELIAKLQHTNLVKLLGCCVEGDEKILVYEYMPNLSLDIYIFGPSEQAHLDWSKRFRIIEGIAQGLLYLHKHSRIKVIHRDLKASNILLDQAMTPKISDFGMARIFEIDQTDAKTKRVVGTYGYMSPEYALYGRFSEKSDVFSFGVLLLEIVSGKRNTDFYHMEQFLTLFGWAWENWKDGRASELIDVSIRETCKRHEVVKCINVALLCVQEFPADRPTISDVVLMLANGSTALIPSPKEPAYSTLKSPTTTAVRQLLPSLQTPSSHSNNGLTISNLQPR